MTQPRPTPDEQSLIDLREHITNIRTEKGFKVDKLPEPPLDFPGVDDKNGIFDWYEVRDENDLFLGYFHTPKGVDL